MRVFKDREQTDHQADKEGSDQREEEYGQIDADFVKARQSGGSDGDQDAQRAECEGKGDGSAGDSEDEAFGEQAGSDFASPGAKRGTDGDLLPAAFGANEEEVGDVGAGDKQDNDNGAHKDP
jgi:hypothetical protein